MRVVCSILVSCTVNSRTKRFNYNVGIVVRAVKTLETEVPKWNDLSQTMCNQVSYHLLQCPQAVSREQ